MPTRSSCQKTRYPDNRHRCGDEKTEPIRSMSIHRTASLTPAHGGPSCSMPGAGRTCGCSIETTLVGAQNIATRIPAAVISTRTHLLNTFRDAGESLRRSRRARVTGFAGLHRRAPFHVCIYFRAQSASPTVVASAHSQQCKIDMHLLGPLGVRSIPAPLHCQEENDARFAACKTI